MREMKDSGIEWIGEIPKHWDVDKIKNNLHREDLKNPGGMPVLSLYREYGVIPKDSRDDNHNVTSEDTSKYKYVRKGSFVINKMKAWQGSVAVSEYEGVVSPAYYVYEFDNTDICKAYFHYLLRCCYKDEFRRMSGGIREGQWDLSSDALDNTLILIPRRAEQVEIASFLDSKCSEIDSISADIQREIEILQEYRRSVITEAVTKGLNSNAEMKDCGVEWIGKIPKHWDVYRAKHISTGITKGNGITKEQVLFEGDIQCVRYGEIYSKYEGSFIDTFSKTNLGLIASPKHIKYGDILFAGTGELVEEIGKNIVFLGKDACLAGGDIVVLSTKQEPRYLNYSFGSIPSQTQKSMNKAKLKVVHISSTDIGNVKVAIPPYEEQIRIANYLDVRCTEIDSLVADKQKQLDTLAKYRKSLIYEYVTGKKEVPIESA